MCGRCSRHRRKPGHAAVDSQVSSFRWGGGAIVPRGREIEEVEMIKSQGQRFGKGV